MEIPMSGGSRSSRLIVLLGVIVLVSLFPIVMFPEEASAYTPHDPITIEGNENFTAANGVTGGSGTPSDPYIIEGWEINASSESGIEIRNTDAHFIIRNVFLSPSTSDRAGISFSNVTYGHIENTVILNYSYGITLSLSNGIVVTGTNVSGNGEVGILLQYSNNIAIARSNISSFNMANIELRWSRNVTIEENELTDGLYGIYLLESEEVSIISNDVSNNGNGISLQNSANVTIDSNNITNQGYGIHLLNSANVTIANSHISGGGFGVCIESSPNITISGNVFTSSGLFLTGDVVSDFNSHTITPDNLVNGEALYYHKDCSSLDIDGIPVGQLIVANCTAVRAANLQIADTEIGIELAFVNGGLLEGNTVFNSSIGIYIWGSSNLDLVGNSLISNEYDGISFVHSTNVTISHNNISLNNWNGVYLDSSTNVSITANNISSNGESGIISYDAANLTIAENSAANNSVGIYLHSPRNVTIARNSVLLNQGNGIHLSGAVNATVVDNVVSKNGVGMLAGDGITLSYSVNSTIVRNNVSTNFGYGIELSSSAHILVYHNNLINNTVQATDDGDQNLWDDGYPSGGNYWSDYPGSDLCSGPNQNVCPDPDGIGDSPVLIGTSSRDNYPLMEPYSAPIFPDTTPPEIVHDSPEYAVLGDDITLTASVRDPGGVREVLLHWKGPGEANFTTINMASIQEDTYEAIITPQEQGIFEYYITATDNAGNVARHPEDGVHSIMVEDVAVNHLLMDWTVVIVILLAIMSAVVAFLVYLVHTRRKVAKEMPEEGILAMEEEE